MLRNHGRRTNPFFALVFSTADGVSEGASLNTIPLGIVKNGMIIHNHGLFALERSKHQKKTWVSLPTCWNGSISSKSDSLDSFLPGWLVLLEKIGVL